jgi:hypothetical protein
MPKEGGLFYKQITSCERVASFFPYMSEEKIAL